MAVSGGCFKWVQMRDLESDMRVSTRAFKITSACVCV